VTRLLAVLTVSQLLVGVLPVMLEQGVVEKYSDFRLPYES